MLREYPHTSLKVFAQIKPGGISYPNTHIVPHFYTAYGHTAGRPGHFHNVAVVPRTDRADTQRTNTERNDTFCGRRTCKINAARNVYCGIILF